MENDSTNEQIVEVETMTDEALEEVVNGPSEPEVVPANVPAESGESSEEASSEVVETPKTVDELQTELDASNTRADQLQAERDFHQQTVGKHSAELGHLRKQDEALQERLAQNKAKDPAQMFIDDPQSMMDAAAERAEINLEMRNNANQVEQVNRNNAVMQNAYQIDTNCPDLKDNMEGIVSMMQKEGSTPAEAIQAFRQNPAAFPAESVHRLNLMYRQEKTIAERDAQIENYKTRGADQLAKVEKVAQHQPMTNAATGATANGDGGFSPNMSTAEVAELSDKDIDAIIAAGRT